MVEASGTVLPCKRGLGRSRAPKLIHGRREWHGHAERQERDDEHINRPNARAGAGLWGGPRLCWGKKGGSCGIMSTHFARSAMARSRVRPALPSSECSWRFVGGALHGG